MYILRYGQISDTAPLETKVPDKRGSTVYWRVGKTERKAIAIIAILSFPLSYCRNIVAKKVEIQLILEKKGACTCIM